MRFPIKEGEYGYDTRNSRTSDGLHVTFSKLLIARAFYKKRNLSLMYGFLTMVAKTMKLSRVVTSSA